MMDFINFLVCDQNLKPIVTFIRSIINIIQLLIPIGLIIMGCIDLGKAVLSSDDKEIKQATSKLIKRAIAAVAVFFLVFIVKLVMNLVAESGENTGGNSWLDCWNNSGPSGNSGNTGE